MMRLEGASAVVSGGASGLGAATVLALAARGMSVVALDRDGWVGTPPDGAVLCRGDVTDPDSVATAIETARSLGPVRVVVSCAGVGSAQRVASRSSTGIVRAGDPAAFRRVIDINLIGTFNMLSLGAAAIAESANDADADTDPDAVDSIGAIVNTASIAAFEGQVGQAAYAASKAAVVSLTFTAARDLAPLRIRVNGIAPGLMETPLISTIRDDVKQGLVDTVVHPRRAGRPDEFAALALHLIENEYINGETVRLDAASRLPYVPPVGRS
jgi:NAD(P)-dependent dehydrogenase (short-subunit alcohol dehydrogenase family)